MPPVVIAAAGAVAGSAIASAVTTSVLGATLISTLVSSAISAVGSRLLSKSAGGGAPSFTSEASGRTQIIRSSVEPHKIIYGEVRTSGTLVFPETSGTDNRFLHLVITLAAHEVNQIGNIYVDDSVVPLDGNGVATTGELRNVLRIKKLLGAENQAAQADLVSEVSKWTSDHRLRGIAYIYARLTYYESGYPNGIPNLSAKVQGRKVFDPRDTAYTITDISTANPSVFTTSAAHGFSVGDRVFITGVAGTTPKIGKEYRVNTVPTATTFTVLDSSGEPLHATVGASSGEVTKMEYSNNWALCVADYLMNDQFGFGAGWGEINESDLIAAANICDENVSVASGGTQKRYTCDGVIDTSDKPLDVLQKLVTAAAGAVIFSGGQYTIKAAAYDTPTVTIDENYLRDEIEVQTRMPKNQLFNAVKGVFVDPGKNYLPTDFPPVTNSTYEAQDGGFRIFEDLELPFTTDIIRAQRIAKIILEKARQGIIVKMPCNLKALEIRAYDTVMVNNDVLGWTNKVFRILSWSMTEDGGIDLVMQEESSSSYNWNNGEENQKDDAPDTNLPDPSSPAAPTNLTLASGTSQLFLREDGTVFSRIKASWDAPTDIFVTSGGEIQIQYKKSSETTQEYQSATSVTGDKAFQFILDVEDGESYDVRIRSKNIYGSVSAWVEETDHTVVGKTQPPSNVQNFTAQQNQTVVTFRWDQVPDRDLQGYILRFDTQGAFVWADANSLTKATRGTLVTNAGLPPGSWTVGIKAIDTSGNESSSATTFDIDVENINNIVESFTEHPRWTGTLTNCIKHDVSGALVPLGQDSAADNNFNLFDTYVISPYSQWEYEAPEVDLGFDTSVRIYSELAAKMGAFGETGAADPISLIDYRKSADSYDGFEQWTIGTVNARYFKYKVRIESATGNASITQMKNVIDADDIDQSGTSTISTGGTTVIFDTTYNRIPQVIATVTGAGANRSVVLTSINSNGFTATIYDKDDNDVGGTINWNAKGV